MWSEDMVVKYHIAEDLWEDNRLHSVEGSRNGSVRSGPESMLDPLRVSASLELGTIRVSLWQRLREALTANLSRMIMGGLVAEMKS